MDKENQLQQKTVQEIGTKKKHKTKRPLVEEEFLTINNKVTIQRGLIVFIEVTQMNINIID